MTDYEIYSLLLSGIVILITLCGLVYAGIQLRKTKEQLQAAYKISEADHDWNRRMASQGALKEYNQSILSSGLQSEFDYLNCIESIPLRKIKEGFINHPDLQKELHQLLNFYEGLARGVFQNIYDDEVIKAGRRSAMMKALRAFNSYIERRRKTSSPSAWSDLESLVAQWILDEKDDDSEQGVKRTLVKFYNLFNTEQCVGLAAGSDIVCKTGNIDFDSILDNYQGQSGITYVFGTDQPAYRPSSDVVTMPLSETFQCNDDFIAVFAHELVHSTGHKDRLNRAFMNDSTSTHKDLAMEELGSAFLCADLNIVTDVQNHASYLKSWLKALEDDEKFIFKAAAAAQKAVSFLSQYSGSVESTEHDVQTAL